MVEVTERRDGDGGTAFLLDAVLGSYSQILFNRMRPVGILLLAATLVQPVTAAFGLGAVLLALGLARLFSFPVDSIRAGLFSYNALLVGLGLGAAFQPAPTLVILLVAAVLLAVLATATLNSALGVSFNLPSLTLPFLVVFYLVLSFAGQLKGVIPVNEPWNPLLQGELLPHPVASYLKSLGALFFLPRIDAGLLVLAALLAYSRTGFVLSLVGFAVAYPVSLHLVNVPDSSLHLMMGYNMMLVAIAMGGVWFVPGPSSFLLALAGAVLAGVLTLGGRTILGRLGLPLLILPFNLTVLPMLYAMRQRTRDGTPKAVDFALGTPEQNLNYYQTRLARFGYPYFVPLSLPFLGRWICTQGMDGEHTHKGLWRHGLDFEVRDAEEREHKGGGRRLEDWYCYKLPVLAPGDGTVVKVVDDVPDNPIGEVNTKENWGNLVIIYHSPGLYSMVAHLAKGSVSTKEGAPVRRGEQIGLCGNSGRSPQPHIHFQLQGTERPGAPTIEPAFLEMVEQGEDGERLHASGIPRQDMVVRNLEREPDRVRLFSFTPGEQLRFVVEGPGDRKREETVEAHIDLYGNLQLRSPETRGVLFFENKLTTFTVYDYQGPAGTVLSSMAAALPRVPLESGRGLVWTDHLVSRHFHPLPVRLVKDFIAPFLGLTGLRLEYRAEQKEGGLHIEGRRINGGGSGELVTRVVLDKGLQEVETRFRGRKTLVYRKEQQKEEGR